LERRGSHRAFFSFHQQFNKQPLGTAESSTSDLAAASAPGEVAATQPIFQPQAQRFKYQTKGLNPFFFPVLLLKL